LKPLQFGVKRLWRLEDSIAHTPLLEAAWSICKQLSQAGESAYFVGGCVRDLLRNPDQVPDDIDIATSASVEKMRVLFPRVGFVGKQFGVALVKERGFSFEVATFRKEGTYSDRRHPDSVEAGTLQEDSNRRDFTVNALYFDPVLEELVDFHGGVEDLNARTMRCVGSADDRLFEDPLRILRLFRFACGFQFSIEPGTLSAAKSQRGGILLLSKERILMEIQKLLPNAVPLFFDSFYREIGADAFASEAQNALEMSWAERPEKRDSSSFGERDLHSYHKSFPLTVLVVSLVLRYDLSFLQAEKLFLWMNTWPATAVDKERMRLALYLLCAKSSSVPCYHPTMPHPLSSELSSAQWISAWQELWHLSHEDFVSRILVERKLNKGLRLSPKTRQGKHAAAFWMHECKRRSLPSPFLSALPLLDYFVSQTQTHSVLACVLRDPAQQPESWPQWLAFAAALPRWRWSGLCLEAFPWWNAGAKY
jgi:tRNA nucleotidyltransferase/poly(A) polymerase